MDNNGIYQSATNPFYNIFKHIIYLLKFNKLQIMNKIH